MKRGTLSVILLLLLFISLKAQPELTVKTDHMAIVVSDLDQSAQFYMDILLMNEIKNETQNPKIRWFSFGDNRELHLLEGDLSEVKLNKRIHLALRINDLKAYVDYLREKEYPFENWYGEKTTTNDRPDGVEQIYLQDPDGYWIEVNDDWRKE